MLRDALPLFPHLDAALVALRACLAPHGAACVCPACTALALAEHELEALRLVAWAVRARAHEEAHTPAHLTDGYWRMVWKEYHNAAL